MTLLKTNPASTRSVNLAKLRGIVGSEAMKPFQVDPIARAFVEGRHRAVGELFCEVGGTHVQIGTSYPDKKALRPDAWDLLCAINSAVDPKGLMNPGSLGLARTLLS